MKKTWLQVVVMVLLLLIYSCEQEQEVKPDNKRQDVKVDRQEKGISGKMLANVEFKNGEFISFWETTPGVVGIRHSRLVEKESKNARLDLMSAKLDQLVQQNKSALDIYNEVAIEKKENELELLRAAFARQKTLELNQNRQNPLTDIKPAHAETSKASNQRTLACTPDYYGDNYGAQWFLDRYCVEGGFRFCPTNYTWAYSGRTETTWFKTCAMAADFETGVRFRGWYWKQDCFLWSCSWSQVLNWDYTVLPRRVECWYFTGRGYRESQADGLSNCQRVHFSAMWNR